MTIPLPPHPIDEFGTLLERARLLLEMEKQRAADIASEDEQIPMADLPAWIARELRPRPEDDQVAVASETPRESQAE